MSIDHFVTLGFLVLLQAVLGFDNLLYISLESKRAPAEKRRMVRRAGIAIAVGLRIVLLFVLIKLVEYVKDPLFGLHLTDVVEGEFNMHSLIVLGGGVFIMYTATKEILHMMSLEENEKKDASPRSAGSVIAWIVAMNLVFSFDSILAVMALTDVFWVMATSIVIGGALMIILADRVAKFLEKNRMYEVLGLFILFIVGIMLLADGGHLAHLHLLGNEITPMSQTTFYFVVTVLVLTDVVQSRYRKKLMALKKLPPPAEQRPG